MRNKTENNEKIRWEEIRIGDEDEDSKERQEKENGLKQRKK